MNRWQIAAALIATAALGARCACAGYIDDPAPSFDGAPGKVVYRMAPVQYDARGIDTVVACTNLSAATAQLAIEIYDHDAAHGDLARAAVEPGATVSFATSSLEHLDHPVVIDGLENMDHGKARVSATTAQLSCVGLNRVRATDGSIKESALELVKKVAYGD